VTLENLTASLFHSHIHSSHACFFSDTFLQLHHYFIFLIFFFFPSSFLKSWASGLGGQWALKVGRVSAQDFYHSAAHLFPHYAVGKAHHQLGCLGIFVCCFYSVGDQTPDLVHAAKQALNPKLHPQPFLSFLWNLLCKSFMTLTALFQSF
jgi:hypothetical protein